MNSAHIQDLVKQLSEKRFWGSVRLVIQDGKVVTVEVLQTIKHEVKADETKMVVVVSS